jgi:hypothetical protein
MKKDKSTKLWRSAVNIRLCVPGDKEFPAADGATPTFGDLGCPRRPRSAGRIGPARPGISCLHLTTSVPARTRSTLARECRPGRDAVRLSSRPVSQADRLVIGCRRSAGVAALLLAGCSVERTRAGDELATATAYAAVVGCATVELGALDDGISSADVVGRAIAGQREGPIRAYVGRRAAASGIGRRAREMLYEQLVGGDLSTGMVLRSRNRAGFGGADTEPRREVGG